MPTSTARVFLLQKEVTERIAAPPGGKSYGVLSVLLQLHADVDVPHHVPAGAFTPPPEVESAVVRLVFRDTPRADPGDEAFFRRVVKAAFGQRRKTLGNAVQIGTPGGARGAAAGLRVDWNRSGPPGGDAVGGGIRRLEPRAFRFGAGRREAVGEQA